MTTGVDWIKALKLPTHVMIGLFVASIVLLVLDYKSAIQLADLGTSAKSWVIVAIVISGSLSITGIGSFIKDQLIFRRKQARLATRRTLRKEEKNSARLEAQTAALERIDHLSPKELRHLANCLRDGSQSFYTYVHSPSVSTLAGKGLVYTPGGTHNQDHYPFTIFDFAWKALIDRKDEILTKDAENRKIEAEEKERRKSRY